MHTPFITRRSAPATAALLLIATASPEPAAAADRDIRLVVIISVDQLRADFLTRFSGSFGDNGFARLRRLGAGFQNATLSYGTSATGPGHATISTGRVPRRHGIVGNKWFFRNSPAGLRYAVHHPDGAVVGLPANITGPGKCARNLIGSTIGDELKRQRPGSRVFSVALKDRTAIFLGGKNADGVFWLDKDYGHLVSSTCYANRLPDYVEELNSTKFTDGYGGKTWRRLLPPDNYADCIPLKREWRKNLPTIGLHFPHLLPHPDALPPGRYYRALFATPFGNEVVLEVARRILDHEKLGVGPAPDLLCLGLSANDEVGHIFGPDSPEVMDITLRTDRRLADFLDLLDRRLGLQRCLIVLTADHGVSTPAAVAQQQGLGGGRADFQSAHRQLNQRLRDEFGPAPGGQDYVAAVHLPWVSFNTWFHTLDAPARRRILQSAAELLVGIEGIAGVFRADQLVGPEPPPDDPYRYRAWRSYYPGRSGQLFIRLAPYWYYRRGDFAGHTTGHPQDLQVPLILAGPGVRPGPYFRPAHLCDIAVTLAELLGITLPGQPDGRVLLEALEKPR